VSTFVEAHRSVWGAGPALFLARRAGACRWCGGRITPGDDACYWPDVDVPDDERYRFYGHQACLRVATEAEL
jgi:hypothetical protein